MAYGNILEEELKIRVGQDFFADFDDAKKLGKVDFCITYSNTTSIGESRSVGRGEVQSLLWAEAKKGKSDIYKSIVQLILTIGKARTFDKYLPPAFLGAFDAEKIAFIPYNNIHDIFYINDFNWNVTSSNHETKEFTMVYDKVKTIIDTYSLLFNFEKDSKEIHQFIKENFVVGKSETSKIKIDKNNFMTIYNKWLTAVRPTIEANWDKLKSAKKSILDCDFYLADLLSRDNISFKDNLSVVLNSNIYKTNKVHNDYGGLDFTEFGFSDNQKAYNQFWNKYERPPNELYWDYIIERRPLLVPQDVRERKGSFFTPQIWVELSQKYLTDFLGENWQDDYYIWDCAAGTGNLLTGLTNKYNIYASTLDQQDVDVMKDRIKNGANLLEANVFQFDFLNDSFDKLPKELQDIINNPKKRKKLVLYINPPYAEVSGYWEKEKTGVNQSKIHDKYHSFLGTASRELFTQFMARVYDEFNGCILAEFSKLKTLQGSAFINFRNFFLAKLEKCFIMPGNSFDNVTGLFPIGFKIWNTSKKEKFDSISTEVFDSEGNYITQKSFNSFDKNQYINKWITQYKTKTDENIGFLAGTNGNDFQTNKIVYILNLKEQMANPRGIWINECNLIPMAIYFAVRHSVKATWINDRDQFLFPNKKWEKDNEFQNDCLTYTLFNNNIQSKISTNHWIPFIEQEVDAKKKFESNFMTQYINGKVNIENCTDLFNETGKTKSDVLVFSAEAKAVFDAGRELYKYYHQAPPQPSTKGREYDVNASLYDIKEHFQGRNEIGRMNTKSEDETYNKLMKDLREQLEKLELKIEPKVYEFRFLK